MQTNGLRNTFQRNFRLSRMLIAQARVENLALVSYDSAFRDYDVTRSPNLLDSGLNCGPGSL